MKKGTLFLSVSLITCLSLFSFQCSDDDDDLTSGDVNYSTFAAIEADTTLTFFMQALKASGLEEMLRGNQGPYTIFAPTNSVFARVDSAVLDTLLAHAQDSLRTVLEYHIVRSQLSVNDLKASDSVTTLQGSKIDVDTTLAGGVRLNSSANVDLNGVTTDNGVVYKINGLLIPRRL
jgi:uncharacterized surface protein with fasciclin (FAS1) repeats